MAAQMIFDGLDTRTQKVVIDLLNLLSDSSSSSSKKAKKTKAVEKVVEKVVAEKVATEPKPVSEKKAAWTATLARCRAVLTEQCGTVNKKTGKKTFKQGDVMRVAALFKESADTSDSRIVQLWRELEANPTPAKRVLKKAAKEAKATSEASSVVEDEDEVEVHEEKVVEVEVPVVVAPSPIEPVETDEEEDVIDTEVWIHKGKKIFRNKKAPYYCYDPKTSNYLGVWFEDTEKFDLSIPDPCA